MFTASLDTSGAPAMNTNKILVVEDEEDIRELIHFNLFKEKFEVVTCADGEEALNLAKSQKPDLILLDLMLPKLDGVNVCKLLKEDNNTKTIPVIMLTAKGGEDDIIKGLESGADDYITKPFSPKILVARIKTVLRRTSDKDSSEQSIEKFGIKIDPSKRKVMIDDVELNLTYTEFQILYLLANKAGQVFTRSQIVDSVRGTNHAITDRSVDVQIVGLRKKLAGKDALIETVRGVGYRFKEE
ncbi:MAG: response regulator [Bacteriovoracaceae bacterium]